MDFEQILIRLGVDAKAAMMGMTSFKSWAKGWATDFASTLKHHLLGTVGAGAALFGIERLFESMKERALFIKRLNAETGVSTNTLQGFADELGFVGENFDQLSKPLGKFNVLIGQAKEGIPEARRKLIEWGIAARGENFGMLTTTSALQKLAQQFDNLHDKEKQAALLQQVFGKSWQAVFPIFEQGAKAMADMDKGNFFTKMEPQTIEFFGTLQRAGSGVWNTLRSTFANIIASSGPLTALVRNLETLGSGHRQISSWHDVVDKIRYLTTGIKTEEMKHNEALKEKQDLLNENLKIQEMQNEATKLQNELQDRGKSTVGRMADMARERLGLKGLDPLSRFRAVTPAMVSAMHIDDLEKGAQVAALSGNDARRASLMSQADRLRLQNLALTSKEQDPMKEVRQKLEIVNETLSRSGVHIKSVQPGNHED